LTLGFQEIKLKSKSTHRTQEGDMNSGERRLAALAAALAGGEAALTPPEKKLLAHPTKIGPDIVEDFRTQILAGNDPLGTEFCELRSPEKRRESGATYTPSAIVNAMMAWAAAVNAAPDRVIDPGIGSGRFLTAAAGLFPDAILIGIDIDPLALLMARANAHVGGYDHRLSLQLADYRAAELGPCAGKTLFIGNPPYIRHHDISKRWKTWFAATAQHYGFRASKLAGLHVHFFLRTRELAKDGDYGAFVTAAEWLDVNYGATLRGLLADGLGGSAVYVIDPKAQPFADAFTTSAVTCFNIGNRPSHFTVRAVHHLDDLAPLDHGRTVGWEEMAKARRWSVFTREHKSVPSGFIELGELFRAHRGQVTGANAAWIAGDEAKNIPNRFKRPTITKGRELLAIRTELATTFGLKKVVDLPVSLDELDPEERKAVHKFLTWAKTVGAEENYVAQHRKAWWAIELRPAAPVLVTYMARQAPAFVLNTAKARHLNIAHGLYPRSPLSEKILAAILVWLRQHVGTAGGRVYAGGLVKFEPKELERIPIPAPKDIHAANSAQEMDDAAARRRCLGRQIDI
jgi:adenine-specific DNA-methyltransferase